MNPAFPQDFLSRLRAYAERFDSHPPRILTRFPGGVEPCFPFETDSDKGLGVLLLCASLYAPGEEFRSADLIAGLYARLGDRIFKLNRVPFDDLRKNLSGLPAPADPEARKRVPGILRSVCDFFYRTGGLGRWLTSGEWESLAAALCGEIFWMGKSSRLRAKARYFLWLTTFRPGFDLWKIPGGKFFWPLSAGHARFRLDFFRTKFKKSVVESPENRLEFFTELGFAVFPSVPWKLYPALAAYLQPDKESGFVCRRVQGGCQNCPFSNQCPAVSAVKTGRK